MEPRRLKNPFGIDVQKPNNNIVSSPFNQSSYLN